MKHDKIADYVSIDERALLKAYLRFQNMLGIQEIRRNRKRRRKARSRDGR